MVDATGAEAGVSSAQFILNERMKVVSSTLARLGSVLVTAAFAKAYVDNAISIAVAVWAFGALVLWYGGWQCLGLMRKEV